VLVERFPIKPMISRHASIFLNAHMIKRKEKKEERKKKTPTTCPHPS